MSDVFSPQNTDLNGVPRRIVLREIYSDTETSMPPPSPWFAPMNSSISPPLSDFELADIQASEREFASGEVRVFDSAEDLISDLRAVRRRFQRERGE